MNEKFPHYDHHDEPERSPDEELDPIERMLREDDAELDQAREELLKDLSGNTPDNWGRPLTIAELRQIQDPSSDPSTYDPADFYLSAEGMYDPWDLLMPPDSDEAGPDVGGPEGQDPNSSS
ncbi:hypothetical protein AB0L41_25750 [Amycolatopsis mediterranei]|uniref:hypothetical protein n=1 Tax=Amycolatopsis mediterranei TaxID=33910 RepID=UPI00342A4811